MPLLEIISLLLLELRNGHKTWNNKKQQKSSVQPIKSIGVLMKSNQVKT